MTLAFWLMACWLSFADWLITRDMLALGGEELNPVMRLLFDAGSGYALALKMVCMVGIGLLILRSHGRDPQFATVAAGGTMVFMTLPVTWNLIQLLLAY